jgi:hypothetical protein
MQKKLICNLLTLAVITSSTLIFPAVKANAAVKTNVAVKTNNTHKINSINTSTRIIHEFKFYRNLC